MRECKLRAEIKELRQDVARAGNELHLQKQQRKSTKREKRIMKELGTKMNGKEATSKKLRNVKEQWLDKFRYSEKSWRSWRNLFKNVVGKNITSCYRETTKAF